jgi:hypothetical protein
VPVKELEKYIGVEEPDNRLTTPTLAIDQDASLEEE